MKQRRTAFSFACSHVLYLLKAITQGILTSFCSPTSWQAHHQWVANWAGPHWEIQVKINGYYQLKALRNVIYATRWVVSVLVVNWRVHTNLRYNDAYETTAPCNALKFQNGRAGVLTWQVLPKKGQVITLALNVTLSQQCRNLCLGMI